MERDPRDVPVYFDPRVAGTVAFCAAFLGALFGGELAFVAALLVGAAIGGCVYLWVRFWRQRV